MTKSHLDRAEAVAEIARVYAFRRQHSVAHTGHTVHRLLDAVSALLGKPVVIAEGKPTANGHSD